MVVRYAVHLHYKLRGLVEDGIICLSEISKEHVWPLNFSPHLDQLPCVKVHVYASFFFLKGT